MAHFDNKKCVIKLLYIISEDKVVRGKYYFSFLNFDDILIRIVELSLINIFIYLILNILTPYPYSMESLNN